MKLKLVYALCGLGILASYSTLALPISGEIHFVGGGSLNDSLLSATEFTSLNLSVLGGTQTGDYVGVPGGTAGGWSPFVFDPAPAGVSPLWTITLGPTTYSFDATSVVIVDRGDTHLDIGGTGIARITGLEDTQGEWSLGVTGSRTTFGFVASTRVPDGGCTAALLGTAVAGLLVIRNKTHRKNGDHP
jgi:hypothetical protein